MHTESTVSVVAATIGISFAAAFAGGNLALSHIAIPSLLLPSAVTTSNAPSSRTPSTNSAHLARQWAKVYAIGHRAGPGLALSCSAAYFTAFRYLPQSSTIQGRLYITALIVALLIIPYTLIVMIRTNNELHRRANAAETDRNDSSEEIDPPKSAIQKYGTPDLIRYWGRLNTGRAMIHVVSVALAVTAMVL